ncbi:hypothetical protein P1X15_29710 [Runella sp. MFBS21]|uniref:hypothetical protein n=1 Tax=Runella sp. MFBS21 TaxID=3034018 RepID=UPI0023F8DB40|nr:hypothetical protein [Runella sp. MFBS21]MDF7821829.1 hypothetical protein [Runella sp. MFBS21]
MKTQTLFNNNKKGTAGLTAKGIAWVVMLALFTMAFTRASQSNHSLLESQYVVYIGGVNVNTYHGKISHLVISNVIYLEESELTPAKKYFNEQVFGDFPNYRNSYSSGYNSYYKVFENKYDALAYRKRLIESAQQVNAYNL